jgi:hypothetical protein
LNFADMVFSPTTFGVSSKSTDAVPPTSIDLSRRIID